MVAIIIVMTLNLIRLNKEGFFQIILFYLLCVSEQWRCFFLNWHCAILHLARSLADQWATVVPRMNRQNSSFVLLIIGLDRLTFGSPFFAVKNLLWQTCNDQYKAVLITCILHIYLFDDNRNNSLNAILDNFYLLLKKITQYWQFWKLMNLPNKTQIKI